MSMPRLSLYKPEKGHDYTFLDKTVVEMFTVGGTDVFVHKYLGPKKKLKFSFLILLWFLF